MQNEDKITIKFELTNEFGDHYSQESRFEVFTDLGENEIDRIGEQLNVFLKQVGYIRKNDLIFMEDVTPEEFEALSDFLDDYRADKGEGAHDD